MTTTKSTAALISIPFAKHVVDQEVQEIGRSPVSSMQSMDELVRLLSEFECIDRLSKSIDAATRKEADKARNEAFDLAIALDVVTHRFKNMLMCVDAQIWHQFIYCNRPDEKKYYPLFPDALPTLIPGARLAQVPRQRGHIPDFFIEVSGSIAPVEIKRGPIDKQAIRQLDRYMKNYKMEEGYAVGHKLVTTLQRGMHFCQWEP